MFKKLSIKNYQSHLDSELEFSPGINLIIGESDNGKSAIVRSIKKAAFNRPLGTDFVNWDDPKAIAEVVIDTGKHEIARYVGKNINSYMLDDTEFNAFDKGVPEEIKQVLNVSALNMHEQKNAFFLLDKSPGDIGKYLNTVVNLEVIDSSLSHAKKRVNKQEQLKDYTKKEIESLRTKYASSEWAKLADKETTQLETIDSKVKSNKVKYMNLFTLLDRHESLQRGLKATRPITRHKQDVIDLITSDKEIDAICTKSKALEKLLNGFAIDHSMLATFKKITKEKSKVLELIAVNDGIKVLDDKYKLLDSFIASLQAKKSKLIHASVDAKECKAEYDKLMPDVCPLCEKPK